MQILLLYVVVVLISITASNSNDIHQKYSPMNIVRTQTIWKWCDCGTGQKFIYIWPNNQVQRSQNITVGTILWIKFQGNISKINWKCDGMKKKHSFKIKLNQQLWLSLMAYSDPNNKNNGTCNQSTGHMSFNIWKQTNYLSSIPFTSHTEGYACFKIPSMIRTSNGTFIIFSQARTPGCDDFDRTDLVYKRSIDGGKTWSSLQKLVEIDEKNASNLGYCGHKLVIGNISPAQLRNDSKIHPNRIIAPYTRNNFKLWVTYSDDDGLTWHSNHEIPGVSQTQSQPDCNRNMSYFGYKIDQLKLKNIPNIFRYLKMVCKLKNPFQNKSWTQKLKGPWQFIGIGPSQSLQLKNGRILVPGYHSPIRGLSGVPHTLPISQLYNNFAKGFVLISDDDGQNWRLGQQWPIGEGTNQHQMIQLNDGTILSNSRSLSTGSPQFRLQARSHDYGQTFSPSEYTKIPQPFGGCQGSTTLGQNGEIFVASPNPKRGRSILQYLVDIEKCKINLNGRQRLSLWISRDNGKSYKLNQIIDEGLSAQTSLQFVEDRLFVLYEQADPPQKIASQRISDQLIQNLRVLLPTRFVFRQILVSKKQYLSES